MKREVSIEKLPSGNYSVRHWERTANTKPKFVREWFSDYSLAKRRAADLTLKLEALQQGQPDPTLKPIDIYNRYIDSIKHTHRASTIELKSYHAKPFFESVQHITLHSLKEFKTTQLSKNSVSTVSIRLREIRAVCNWARKEGYLQENLFEYIEVPASKEGGFKPDLSDIKKIWEASDYLFKPYLGFLIYTGARYNEIKLTKWEDLDLDKGVWHIPEENCKTNKARYVPIPAQLVTLLREYPREAGNEYVFGGWVRNTGRWFLRKACKAAEIPKDKWPTPHTFRHAFASYWDGDIRKLMDMCGWTTMLMPKRYCHNNTEDLRREAENKGISASLSL